MAVLNDAPIHSTVRLVADLTEGVTIKTFKHSLSQNDGAVVAFSYAQKESACSEAGYASSGASYINEAFTSLEKRGVLPGDAEGEFTRLALSFGPWKKHVAQYGASPATMTKAYACDPDPSQWKHIYDSAGLVHNHLARCVADCYLPYLQYGSAGEKEFLPSLKLLSSGREFWDGHSAIISAAPYEFAMPRRWASGGAGANLRVGLEPKREIVNGAWAEAAADATGSLSAALRAAAGFPAAASAPSAAGGFVLACDVQVWLIGTTRARQVR